MARRKRLVAPDQSELEKLDEGFAAKPPLGQSMTPPIAQVAGEAAALAGMAGVQDRVAAAKDTADAEKWREAERAGRAVVHIPVDQIQTDYLRRDRMVDDPDARLELTKSIIDHGLRTPIEVAKTEEGYGLIAGHRRLRIFRLMSEQFPRFSEIPAFIRTPKDSADAYQNMVEENEVRANLTHYERGRIAVLATQNGVFGSVDDAVGKLFESASKSKRSKVRSFAAVHEALGDLLKHPMDLSERLGLKVATALRNGAQGKLREGLSGPGYREAPAEAKLLEGLLAGLESGKKDPARGGRPTEVIKIKPIRLKSGGDLSAQISGQGMKIDLKGREVDAATVQEILTYIQRSLG